LTSVTFSYARTSTRSQDLGIQKDAFIKAGVLPENIFEEQESGAKRDRPVLTDLLSRLRPGDTLMIWKLDRLARSLPHLLEIMEILKTRSVHFKSLTENFDTSTIGGELVFQIFGAVAQYERALTKERRDAGLERARASGKKFGRKSASDPTAKSDKSGKLAKALLAVSNGQSIRSAARENGIGVATLHRHLSANSERTNGTIKTERLSERKALKNGRMNGHFDGCSVMN
jgi:DNA invertase Pin-like site-specific DNA recombinase